MDVLPAWVEALGLPAGTVVVGEPSPGAPPEGVWRVVRVATEEAGECAWDVWWAEGGERYSWTRFDEEAAACFHLFGRLAWTQMVRGALASRSAPQVRPR